MVLSFEVILFVSEVTLWLYYSELGSQWESTGAVVFVIQSYLQSVYFKYCCQSYQSHHAILFCSLLWFLSCRVFFPKKVVPVIVAQTKLLHLRNRWMKWTSQLISLTRWMQRSSRALDSCRGSQGKQLRWWRIAFKWNRYQDQTEDCRPTWTNDTTDCDEHGDNL